jgi:gliding motility-associated-like protein
MNAQLGFCNGSKGDPIFHEDFTGVTSLPPGVTNYPYVTGDPQDGQYTVSSQIGSQIGGWHTSLPPTTISNGKALIVNADDNSAGRFYRFEVDGLCQSTTYEFSAFLMNIYNYGTGGCDNRGIPINVKFQIWDETDSVLLAEGDTGDIGSTINPQWRQYALTFRSQPGQGAIILKMFNNGVGGCGNDLAIDDIIFRSCGDFTEISSEIGETSPLVFCQENTPGSTTLKAESDSSVYTSQFYQWQVSTDNSSWADIPGANQHSLSVSSITSSVYYRVKVAEDAANLTGSLCSSASEAFFVQVAETPAAPVSRGDKTVCSNENIPALAVDVESDETVNWYDAPTGGNLVNANSRTFTPSNQGTFYAEAIKKDLDCNPGPRTAVKLAIYSAPQTQDEEVFLCSGSSLELDAGLVNMSYSWSTGEATRKINVTSPGRYSVKITNANNCSDTKNFEVTGVDLPVITNIRSKERTVVIDLEKQGDFEYSLDGQNFEPYNEFPDIKGGVYTAHVRSIYGCEVITRKFAHLVIPQFITPNNDGRNDFFEVRGISFFGASQIKIFDRYGRLIKTGAGANFRWDGTLSGKPVTAEDYWYEIYIEGFAPQKGHFSLLR